MPVIIGIDPGSNITGYGVIRAEGSEHRYLASGCVRINAKPLSERLQQIYDGISEVMRQYMPDEGAIEQVFMHQNPNTALKLGQARGAAIVAMAVHTIDVAEYSARQIKQSVVGYGAAQKQQVQHMVQRILNLPELPPSDAADALGVALTHAHMRQGLQGLGGARATRRGRVR